MKYLKKVFKVLRYVFIAAFILVAMAECSLRFLVSTEAVKAKLQNLIVSGTGAQASIGTIRASLLGIKIRNIKFAADKEDIFFIKEVKAGLEPFALLAGKIRISYVEIKGFNANIVKQADGSFNFEHLFAKSSAQPAPAKEQGEVSLPLLLRRAYIKDSFISYTDKQQNMHAELRNIFFDVRKFTLNQPFEAGLNFNVFYNDASVNIQNLHFGVSTIIDLQSLLLDKAQMQIKLLALKFRDTSFALRGSIKNFNNPQIELTANLLNLSDSTLSGFAAAPAFTIPQIDTDLYALLDLKNNIFKINKLSVNLLSSSIVADGQLGLSNPAQDYKFNITAQAAIAEIGKAVQMLNPYKPAGTLNLSAQVAPKDITADINFAEVGALIPQAGDLAHLNSQIKINGLKDINLPYLKGKLNGLPFSAKASFKQKKEKADINFSFKAAHLLFKDTPDFLYRPKTAPQPLAQEQQTTPAQPQSAPQSAWPLPPAAIKGEVKIGTLDSQYFKGDKFAFNADMQGITPKLDHAQGSINFNMVDGQIKDLYKLANMNGLTKVMFLSLVVVSKVINSLNVLEILGNVGEAMLKGKAAPQDDSAAFVGEEPAPQAAPTAAAGIAEPAPATHREQRKLDGKLDFITLNTALDFKDGVSTVKQANFVSNLLSFKISGTTNFKNGKLDMTVNTAPGRHEDDGIMPLTLKIGGSVQEPQGSLSMIGSVAALLTQTVTNNAASDLIKKGISSVSADKQEPAQTAETQPQEQTQVAPLTVQNAQ